MCNEGESGGKSGKLIGSFLSLVWPSNGMNLKARDYFLHVLASEIAKLSSAILPLIGAFVSRRASGRGKKKGKKAS